MLYAMAWMECSKVDASVDSGYTEISADPERIQGVVPPILAVGNVKQCG